MLLPSNECDNLPSPAPVSDWINFDAIIYDYLGYAVAPTDVSVCYCSKKIYVSFYFCHHKMSCYAFVPTNACLFHRLFNYLGYSYYCPNRCQVLTVEDHDLGTDGGHGAGGVGVGGAPTDVAALVTHLRPADNQVTQQRERTLLIDPFGYQNSALPVLIPISH